MDTIQLSNLPVPAVDVLKPSKEFKKQVLNVINAIVSFAIVYILLFFSAIIIACAMAAAGYLMITNVSMFIVMILGLGLILSGAMLVFFLIKFLFTKSAPTSLRYEVTKTDQPQLFDFIHQLTTEAGAPFPKHIYLTPEVNASVFFDSSFWSMFFPVKKNLNIGLALVNTLNQSEFRAVLAHEFGHFSQRSMRFGSYVYSLNKVIYNVLYQNKGYDKMLNAWSRWHNVLRLTAILNVKIVKCIQYVLKKMYVNINKNHMALSREMEFHADVMAAYYTGANNMASALRRLDAGGNSYSTLLGFLNNKLTEGYCATNIYPMQLIVLKRFAVEHHLKIDDNDLPVINTDIAALKNSRVIIQDQWSSHPTTNDRIENVNKLDIIAEPINKPAWLLFKDITHLQEHFTKQLYASVNNYKDLKIIDTDTFNKSFEDEIKATTYNKTYKGFYDARLITAFDIDDAITNKKAVPHTTFADLFSIVNCNLPKAITGMQSDIQLLDAINNNTTDEINTFDFEGIKYQRYDAEKIKNIISEQLKTAQQQLADLDEKIFIFFYNANSNAAMQQSLIDQYKKIFRYQELAKLDYETYNNIMSEISPIYSKMGVNAIYDTLNKVYDTEKTVKARIKEVLADSEITSYINEVQKKAIDKYLSKNWIYYIEPSYDNNAINAFTDGMNAYVAVISERNFQIKKSTFDFQLTL